MRYRIYILPKKRSSKSPTSTELENLGHSGSIRVMTDVAASLATDVHKASNEENVEMKKELKNSMQRQSRLVRLLKTRLEKEKIVLKSQCVQYSVQLKILQAQNTYISTQKAKL